MARKLTTGVLIVAGLWLIATGTQRWLDRRAARQVVHAFLEAVTSGDRQAAQALMVPEARISTEDGQSAPEGLSPVSSGIDYRVDSLNVDGNRAAADTSIEKDAIRLRFTVELRQITAGGWKVSRIGTPRVEVARPLETGRSAEQTEQLREQQREAGKQLARELREALKDRPGVSVKRVPLSNAAE